jgi:phospholipase/carboxylesterase
MVASRDLLARFVEDARAEHAADADRTFLFGFSQGAIMSLALLLARPDLVRGVVAHSGALARLPGPTPTREALARNEVLLLHGALDDVIPVAAAGKATEVLSPLLPGRITCRVFQDLGHGVSEESVAEAARWLSAHLEGGRGVHADTTVTRRP